MCWEGAVSKIDFFLCIFVVFFVSVGQVLIRWSARESLINSDWHGSSANRRYF
jgi:hypothetical protein